MTLKLFAGSPVSFMVLFLLCGCFVTCTQIAVPKTASGYMKNTSRGFEFAIISSFGGLGEMLGNLILGKIVNTFSLNYVVMIFCVSYFMIAIMAGMGFKNEKIRILE